MVYEFSAIGSANISSARYNRYESQLFVTLQMAECMYIMMCQKMYGLPSTILQTKAGSISTILRRHTDIWNFSRN